MSEPLRHQPPPNALSAEPELTVIIVSYNTADLTLRAIETLLETTKATRFHTVVFDNASSDGSADRVAEVFPDIELIRSDENLGFATANNRVAATVETEWLLLLNPDTETYPGAIDNLMAFARANPRGGIYGGRTEFPDGSLNIASCWKQLTPWGSVCRALGLTALFPKSEFFNPEAMGDWQRDTVREVDIVVGCFLLIPTALWNELGGFNLKYFMYGEEADLCLRARAMGYRPMITPDATIMHLVGAAASTKATKLIQVAKAKTTLVRDHWPAWQVPFGLAMQWLWAGLRLLEAEVASLFPGEDAKARRERWRTVWKARREWLGGYHD